MYRDPKDMLIGLLNSKHNTEYSKEQFTFSDPVSISGVNNTGVVLTPKPTSFITGNITLEYNRKNLDKAKVFIKPGSGPDEIITTINNELNTMLSKDDIENIDKVIVPDNPVSSTIINLKIKPTSYFYTGTISLIVDSIHHDKNVFKYIVDANDVSNSILYDMDSESTVDTFKPFNNVTNVNNISIRSMTQDDMGRLIMMGVFSITVMTIDGEKPLNTTVLIMDRYGTVLPEQYPADVSDYIFYHDGALYGITSERVNDRDTTFIIKYNSTYGKDRYKRICDGIPKHIVYKDNYLYISLENGIYKHNLDTGYSYFINVSLHSGFTLDSDNILVYYPYMADYDDTEHCILPFVAYIYNSNDHTYNIKLEDDRYVAKHEYPEYGIDKYIDRDRSYDPYTNVVITPYMIYYTAIGVNPAYYKTAPLIRSELRGQGREHTMSLYGLLKDTKDVKLYPHVYNNKAIAIQQNTDNKQTPILIKMGDGRTLPIEGNDLLIA